jgi:hypothetical protein
LPWSSWAGPRDPDPQTVELCRRDVDAAPRAAPSSCVSERLGRVGVLGAAAALLGLAVLALLVFGQARGLRARREWA